MALVGDDEVELLDGDGGIVGNVAGAGDAERGGDFRAGEIVRAFREFLAAQDRVEALDGANGDAADVVDVRRGEVLDVVEFGEQAVRVRRAVAMELVAGLLAGALWGLVFVAPTMLAEYPPVLLSMGRYLAFGLIALPLAFAITFGAGVLMERLVIRHLYHRPLETLLATFGISIALQQLAKRHKPDFIVPEIEAIRTEVLLDVEKEGFEVIPSARAANLTMNRDRIRDVAVGLGVRTAQFSYADSAAELLTKAL